MKFLGDIVRMKILFLADVFRIGNVNEKIGGGEISNILLLQELSVNHDVYVVAAYGGNFWNVNKNGIVCFYLSSSKLLAWLPYGFRKIAAKIVYRYVVPYLSDSICPDVILCSSYMASTAIKIAEAKDLVSGVFIRAFENFKKNSQTHWGEKVRDIVRFIVYGDFTWRVLNKMDLLIPNSDFMKGKCANFFLDMNNIHVCYPPMDTEMIARGYPKSIKTALMVSTEEKKGYDLFRKIAGGLPDISFLAIGDAGTKGKRCVSNNLQITGWIDNLEDVLSGIDLVLVPSVWEEPFGRIAVEALRCGCVVLVSNKGGLPETVDYQDLLIVDSVSDQDWVDRISSFGTNRARFIEALSCARVNSEKYRLRTQANFLELALLGKLANR